MPNLNRVFLIGNLTRDPEVRYTPKGSPVCDLGLALNRTYTLDSGERREETTFVDVTLWGRQAEVAGEYLKKGRAVFIEGRLQLDTWEDKQTGQKRSRLRVVGEGMQLLDKRAPGDSGPAPGGAEPAPNRTDRPARGPAGPDNHVRGADDLEGAGEEDNVPF
jgi:single-strand DNA-binding protein